jgi:DinB superfamily
MTENCTLDPEREALLASLRKGRAALGLALAGVDDHLAAQKPPSGGWSILECVEHVVQTERYLLTRLHAAVLAPEPFEKSRRAAKIAALAVDRTRRIEAPPKAHPHGVYRNVSEALAAFDTAHAEVERYVEETAGDLNCWITDHPLISGPVTCRETLIMIAAHPARHAEQIWEVRKVLETTDSADGRAD